MGTRPTVISTFSGCGGSSLGYRMAGFRELLAIDFDGNSVETFGRNFPDVPVWKRDMCEVTSKEIMDFVKIGVGELDVLDGSPPCQGFSMAGNRNISDNRNDLFLEFVRLVEEIQPKVFIMENVSGQVKGKMRGMFIQILKIFMALNYRVKAKLLNSKYYGVPQSRERLFYIGVRKDLNIEPKYPVPSNKIVSFGNAVRDLKITEEKMLPGTAIRNKVLALCNEGENGGKYNNGKLFSWVRVSRLRPCPTISKTACLLHWVENRYLTISELKRASSFPDDFQFLGTFRQQWSRIGNAVMPLQMKAVAETIKKDILDVYYKGKGESHGG